MVSKLLTGAITLIQSGFGQFVIKAGIFIAVSVKAILAIKSIY
jgi:hypothetical protein